MKKFVFFVIWIIFLLLIPATILRITPLSIALKNHVTLTNFVQRFLGLAAFTLLFVQLILGAFMEYWTEKLGAWIFRFHIFEGILIYSLALLHPIIFMAYNHYVGAGWNPYAVFINVCVLCQTSLDFYYTLGIISFWLLTLTVFAGLFRAANPWIRLNWRKLHVLNYLVFLVVGLHGFLVGTDFKVQPFYTFAIVAYAIVAGIVLFIEFPKLYKNYMNWLRS
jgi:predicted ferric reductase